MSSFFYGYAASQIPAGFLAGRYGGKWVFGMGNLVTAIGTLLSPLAANTSKHLFIVVRVIEGLAEVNFKHSKLFPVTNLHNWKGKNGFTTVKLKCIVLPIS